MLMISEKATTLYVRSAISDIRELLGPHGSLDVASLTLRPTQKIKVRDAVSTKTRKCQNNTCQSQWAKPIFITGWEEGVGENKHHCINSRNKSRMLQDAATAFKSQTHDSVGVENPHEQRRTQPWFRPRSNCGRCSLLVAVAMKSTWQRSGRRVMLRSEWKGKGRVLNHKQTSRTNSDEHGRSEMMCEPASPCVDAKSPSNSPVTQEWGRVRVFHSGSAVFLLICRFLWHHWVPICQASGDENCMRKIGIHTKMK